MAERLILLLALVAGAAAAQPLGDPTRPFAEGAAAAPRHIEATPGTRLQSVLISPSRSIAVIDGRAVRLGERVGEATLVSIEPSQVILQRGAAYERLSLLPGGVQKTPVTR